MVADTVQPLSEIVGLIENMTSDHRGSQSTFSVFNANFPSSLVLPDEILVYIGILVLVFKKKILLTHPGQ